MKPKRVALSWLSIIILFALIYYFLNALPDASFLDYVYFSIITAITPGYGGYHIIGKYSKLVASLEAIIGTLWWGFIIATIARKYFR